MNVTVRTLQYYHKEGLLIPSVQMFKEQIAKLTEALSATEALQQEVEQMQSVDFDRYSKIVVQLQLKSDSYCLFKLFSDRIFSHVNDRFSGNRDEWAILFKRLKNACDETILFDDHNENPLSEKAQRLADKWWSMSLKFLGGACH